MPKRTGFGAVNIREKKEIDTGPSDKVKTGFGLGKIANAELNKNKGTGFGSENSVERRIRLRKFGKRD